MSKEVQEIVGNFNQDGYVNIKNLIKKIVDGDMDIMLTCQEAICIVLENRTISPGTYLYALKFAKDTIESFNQQYIQMCEHSILVLVGKIVKYRLVDKSKGCFYFSDKPDKNQRVAAMECVKVWALWFPFDADGKPSSYVALYNEIRNYDELKGYTYFKQEVIDKHLPPNQKTDQALQKSNIISQSQGLQNSDQPQKSQIQPVDNSQLHQSYMQLAALSLSKPSLAQIQKSVSNKQQEETPQQLEQQHIININKLFEKVDLYFKNETQENDSSADELAIFNAQAEDLLLECGDLGENIDQQVEAQYMQCQDDLGQFMDFYQQYNNKEISFSDFRNKFRKLLTSDGDITPQPPQQQFQKQQIQSQKESMVLMKPDGQISQIQEVVQTQIIQQSETHSIQQPVQQPQTKIQISQQFQSQEDNVPDDEQGNQIEKQIQSYQEKKKEKLKYQSTIQQDQSQHLAQNQQLKEMQDQYERQISHLQEEQIKHQQKETSSMENLKHLNQQLEEKIHLVKQLTDENTNLQIEKNMLAEQLNLIQNNENPKEVGVQTKNLLDTKKENKLLKAQYKLLQAKYDELDTNSNNKDLQIEQLLQSVKRLEAQNQRVEQMKLQSSQIHADSVVSRQQRIFDSSLRPNFQSKYRQLTDSQIGVDRHQDKGIHPPFLDIIVNGQIVGEAVEEKQDIVVEPILTEYMEGLIFPYKTTLDYYLNQNKQYQGELYRCQKQDFFREIDNFSKKNQQLLIKSCQCWQSLLYENSYLLIFQQSQQIIFRNSSYLSITLQLRNISQSTLNIQIKLHQPVFGQFNNYQNWVNPELSQQTLYPKKAIQYEFIISPNQCEFCEVQLDIQTKKFQKKLERVELNNLNQVLILQNPKYE